MNILVTGGAGYIGSHIVEKLVQFKKYKIFILDDLSTGYRKLINKKTKFVRGSITNYSLVKKIINENNIQSIIHLAAKLNVTQSEKNKKKYYNTNIIGTKNIVSACKNSSVKNIILSSSCSIYGNVKGSVKEEIKPNPKSYYAYTKLMSENLIKNYSRGYKFKYMILRYFNVAGASNSGKIGEINKSHDHLIKNIAIQSKKINPKIYIYGNDYLTKDGTCIRDYMHVSDLASIHVKSLITLNKTKKSFILNCGYGRGYSVMQIAKIFKKIKKNLEIIISKRRPGDVAQVYSNIDKLKKILNWKPKYNDINKIILSSINWEKKLK